MQFTAVLRTINEMKQAGVIDHYAIGGAVGATFYLEPIATLDIDIFVNFATVPGQLLASPRPIFDFMLARGAVAKGEYLIVEGWPVQFLPPPSLLCEEALLQATEKRVDSIPVWVFSAEHLAAIALETGRPKDKARLLQFIESGILDAEKFGRIVESYLLSAKWQQFQRQFLEP